MPVHVYDVLYCVFAAQIVNSRLQFRYDLGSGDHILTLPAVNVSDGMRHFVRVSRYGNGAVLRLDAGEGRFYAERWPTDEHRALKLELASGGGEVIRNFWTNQLHTRAIIDSQLLCNFSTTYLIYFYLLFYLLVHSNVQSSCTSVFTGLHLRTLLTSFVTWQMSRLVSDFVPVHLCH